MLSQNREQSYFSHVRWLLTDSRFHLRTYLEGGLDWNIWGYAALFLLSTINTYSIAYFLPIILRDGMGFTVTTSQCLTAPPYVFAAAIMFAFAWASDKWRIRSPFVLANGVLLLIGT